MAPEPEPAAQKANEPMQAPAKTSAAAPAVPTVSTAPAAAGPAKASVGLKAVPLASLPTATAELSSYLTAVHKQAYDLITPLSSRGATDPWKHHSSKKTGEQSVETFAHDIHDAKAASAAAGASSDSKAPHAETEHWFARRSFHDLLDGVYVEEGGKGLRWADFTDYLLKDHAEHEQEYIGSVKRVDRVDSSRFQTEGVAIEGWKDVRFGVYAIHHGLPWPLNPRVFPIALFSAMKDDGNEFIVVSLPVELPKDTEADVVDSDGKSKKKAKVLEGMTCGRYVAVELVRRLDGEGAAKRAVWLMATASDAEGNLPMSMQKLGIPGAIVKDVPWFCEWIEKKKRA